jgi:hypothetical protein
MTTLGRCVGLLDRQGFDATSQTYLTWGHAAFNSVLGGVVCDGTNVTGGMTWRQLQTSAGSPPGSHALAAAGTTYIDNMFDQADAYNNTNPVLHGTSIPMLWTIMLRVFAGEYSPTWAQALAGGGVTGSGGAAGCWWTTGANSFIAAFEAFMAVLAAYVPSYTVRSVTSSGGLAVGVNTHALAGHPLLGQLIWGPTMTLYAETMMKVDFTGGYNTWSPANASLPTPYTYALDQAALSGSYASITGAWGTTPVSVSHNPYVEVSGNGQVLHVSETVALMATLHGATTWPNGVLANNSLRANGLTYPPADGSNPAAYADPHGISYTTQYSAMAGYGVSALAHTALGLGAVPAQPMPIEFQTSQYASMGGTVAQLLSTIAYGTWLGARALEMPNDVGGYTNATLAQLAATVPGLLANDPASSTPTATSGSTRHWRAYRHH